MNCFKWGRVSRVWFTPCPPICGRCDPVPFRTFWKPSNQSGGTRGEERSRWRPVICYMLQFLSNVYFEIQKINTDNLLYVVDILGLNRDPFEGLFLHCVPDADRAQEFQDRYQSRDISWEKRFDLWCYTWVSCYISLGFGNRKISTKNISKVELESACEKDTWFDWFRVWEWIVRDQRRCWILAGEGML